MTGQIYDVSRGHPVFLLSGALMINGKQCDGKVFIRHLRLGFCNLPIFRYIIQFPSPLSC